MLNGLSAGYYSVTVSDSLGCLQTADFTLAEPNPLAIVIDSTSNVRCNGESNGLIQLTVNGGSAPYQFQWSNGSTYEDQTELPAGQYDLTVTDSLGCITQLQQLISEPAVLDPLISGTALTVTNVSCHGGSDGSVQLSVQGGVPPYIYDWSDGSSGPVVNGLSAGPINVTVIDQNGCSAIASANLSEPDQLVPQILSVSTFNGLFNISCYGYNDGAIDMTVEGGTPPYAYTWSNGELTEDIYNLAAGTYELVVTDSMGCTGTYTVSLNEPDSLQLALSSPVFANGSNIACVGSSTGGCLFQCPRHPIITAGIPPELLLIPCHKFLLDTICWMSPTRTAAIRLISFN
jgi:hypothetical protein